MTVLDATCLGALDRARALAVGRGAGAVALAHFLSALLDDPESDLAASLPKKSVDASKVRALLEEVMETIPAAKKRPGADAITVTPEVEAWMLRAQHALGDPTHLLRSAFLLEQLALDPLGGRKPKDTELDAGWVRDRLAELGALPTPADAESRVFEGLREEAESGTVGVRVPGGAKPRAAHVYRYFACAPTNFGDVTCDVCDANRRGYAGPFFGDGDVDEVCETCIQEGKLAARDVVMNSGDAGALARALRAHDATLDAPAARKLAKERTQELETRTPRPEHWQEHAWPIHCGDYCAYRGEVGVAELTALAGDGDPQAFFAAHLPEDEECDVEEIWEGIRPAAPKPGEGAFDVGVYHYGCITCGRPLLLWDCS